MKKELVSFEGVHCANCAAAMQGEFCHECGQSIHTVLRPMHHMVEDTVEMLLHVDARVLNTLPPLLYRPGFLTMEYFSGRRQRYVAPFRMMFVLCLLAFFVCHVAVENFSFVKVDTSASAGTGEFAKDLTGDAVRAHYQQLHDDTHKGTSETKVERAAIKNALASKRDQANHRLEQLGAAPLETRTADDWNFQHKQVHLSWLTDGMNASFNRSVDHAIVNMKGVANGGEEGADARERILAGTFAVLPQTLFFLMPLFALLLKVVYIFRRRLYMEHLIVALHSHAFLFLSLLLGMLLVLLRGWLVPHAAWVATPLTFLCWALLVWAPIYLLLMQKRVYRQGWFMTTVKYLFLGWCYCWLFGSALGVAAFLGLSH
ncbi:DUF3667 domain-containing protein [Dyella sp. Tek66A03]|uniref:DUF3667 domain-containing protein n=1 Tax=Dyella sp. Tek66A03 TaxID=3458298 RepID=UPI00403EDD5B